MSLYRMYSINPSSSDYNTEQLTCLPILFLPTSCLATVEICFANNIHAAELLRVHLSN